MTISKKDLDGKEMVVNVFKKIGNMVVVAMNFEEAQGNGQFPNGRFI
jgi:hypothetical protein